MTAAELKASILDLAVRGQLVPQDPKDKPADKPSDIDDPPYELPRNWVWKRLGEVTTNFGQKKPDESFCYIDVGSIDNSIGMLNPEERIVEAVNAPSRARKIVKKGAVLYSCVRPYLLNVCVVDRDFSREVIASTAFAVLNPVAGVFNKYLFHYLRSPVFVAYTKEVATGQAYPAISDSKFYDGFIPLPPLPEQKRIVAKIEELMPLVEEYGEAQKELEALNADFPAALRESILQDAVQGKLTAEWRKSHRGESAADLLAQIAAERAAGGRARTPAAPRKKEKPLPPITDDEKPFEIPDTWAWCRLGEIGITQTGSTPSTKNKAFYGKDIPFIKPADIYDDHIDYENCGLSFAGAAVGRVIAENSILMVCIGTIGKTYFTDRKVSCNQQINAITPFGIDVRFLLIAMQSPYFQMTAWDESSSTTLSILNKSTWSNIAIPLPPLAEQKAIVERVDELLKIVDAMKAQ